MKRVHDMTLTLHNHFSVPLEMRESLMSSPKSKKFKFD